ncbi:hypothetical protein SLEP1_g35856 [Rubroshorea leprosula]|uniref:ATP-dependent Clp protease proteolytic subunit n=1 Tax=Rubroshorea leprosula TaxID=152421 RepID=A0AAV5KPU9_9ROSI|nr:hypothetical protein SLEP1_g35856 [Rubroshorea leprosula]
MISCEALVAETRGFYVHEGHSEDVRCQVDEAVRSRHKIDKMYAAFTGQPFEKVQLYTERDHYLSVAEAMEFGLIDGILETEF